MYRVSLFKNETYVLNACFTMPVQHDGWEHYDSRLWRSRDAIWLLRCCKELILVWRHSKGKRPTSSNLLRYCIWDVTIQWLRTLGRRHRARRISSSPDEVPQDLQTSWEAEHEPNFSFRGTGRRQRRRSLAASLRASSSVMDRPHLRVSLWTNAESYKDGRTVNVWYYWLSSE